MSRAGQDGSARKEQRDRVLEAAAALFAEKGFGGTGMRELARRAGVSLSMINYYFGSKQGVLEKLLDDQHDRYVAAVKGALESAETVEGKVRAWVRAAVTVARHQGAAMRVAFIDLPREAPGVLEQKASRIHEVVQLMATHVFGPIGRTGDMHFLGPALGSAVMSHFMIRPMLERVVAGLPTDDAFFERYVEAISGQLLYGLVGRPPPAETEAGRTPAAPAILFPGLKPAGPRPDAPE